VLVKCGKSDIKEKMSCHPLVNIKWLVPADLYCSIVSLGWAIFIIIEIYILFTIFSNAILFRVTHFGARALQLFFK